MNCAIDGGCWDVHLGEKSKKYHGEWMAEEVRQRDRRRGCRRLCFTMRSLTGGEGRMRFIFCLNSWMFETERERREGRKEAKR